MSKKTNEIKLIEKITGISGQGQDKMVASAISTLKQAWSENPKRFKKDIDILLSNTVSWNWPLQVYTTEQRKEKEARLRKVTEINRSLKMSEMTSVLKVINEKR